MYLEIDEGFPGHRKTLRLCSLLRNPEAGWLMIKIWTWACRSCPDGDLSGMTPYDLEIVAQWRKLDGNCYKAMVDAGFIDESSAGAPSMLHNWMKRTGGSIKKMETAAEDKKLYRAHRDGKCNRQSCKHCAKEEGQSKDSPRTVQGHGMDKTAQDQTRQDKTRPDKTRQDPEGEGAPSKPLGKIRPDSAHHLLHCLKMAVEHQPNASMWAAEPLATKNADEFLRSLGDVEKALPDLEKRIAIFAADPDMQPWTVKKFCEKYNGIGLPKLEFGRAPEVKRQARY
jgi:hypothetical protein